MKTNNNSGIILVAVVCFTAITAVLVLGLLSESGTQVKLAAYNVNKEQALYAAESGAERAVAFIANSGVSFTSTNITGSIGNGTYAASIVATNVATATLTAYTIASTGTVNGVQRNVILTGVHQQSWAKYAMFYNTAAASIVMQTGEHFYGPVHANTKIYLSGDPGPTFEQLVSSTATNWGDSNRKATFYGSPVPGYQFNARSQDVASISFPTLMSNATLIVTGATSIRISGTNLFITNKRRGWNQTNYAVINTNILSSGNGLIYVASTGTGATTNRGTVNVGGTNLNGRLSIVTDGDIIITNNITYANTNITPGLTNTSNDALGLISKNDVVVAINCPDTLYIYAHIVADCPTNAFVHGFTVQDYSGSHNGGNLNVYGGIVEFTRGAVGQSPHGYQKNYTYDTRFATNPPPSYPVLTNEFVWGGWQDKTP